MLTSIDRQLPRGGGWGPYRGCEAANGQSTGDSGVLRVCRTTGGLEPRDGRASHYGGGHSTMSYMAPKAWYAIARICRRVLPRPIDPVTGRRIRRSVPIPPPHRHQSHRRRPIRRVRPAVVARLDPKPFPLRWGEEGLGWPVGRPRSNRVIRIMRQAVTRCPVIAWGHRSARASATSPPGRPS